MNAPLQLRNTVGAPRGGATRPGERTTGVLAFSRRLVPLLFLVILLAVLEMFFRALSGVANVPISKVSVNGDFRFLDKARLEEIMLPHLGTGYFMVDLQNIRDELQAQLQDRVQEFARMRDELIVQANLARLEAREEWAELEARLAQLQAKADEAGDIAEDTAEAMAESAKEVLAELQSGYEKLRKLL